jgi:hypothetical protein
MAFDPQHHYSVVEDFDGLHVIPMYRVIRRSETLLCNASLASCGAFVAAYLEQIASGQDPRKACVAALEVAEAS